MTMIPLTPGAPADPSSRSAALAVLRERFGDRLSTGEAVCRQHANTLTYLACEPPEAVVFAASTAEVAAVVDVARTYRMPIIPFGAGTSLEGHVNAPMGGICLDLSGMNRVLAVNVGDMDCTVEAGVSRKRLAEDLRATGLFFSVDPGSEDATLGGMAATRASGTCTVRYGTMRENVIALTAVMADGRIIKTATRAKKSAAGYDLTHLLVGSEGTLGIITELTLRLHPVPDVVVAAVVPFATLEQACTTTMAAMGAGLGLARIELLDALQIHAVNRHAGLALAETPTLFVEIHGTAAAAAEQVGLFAQIAQEHGARSVDWASEAGERKRLWRARHDALWAIRSTWPGRATLVTDVCVPLTRLAECVAATQADIVAHGLLAPIVGHVGDGNFHTLVLFDAGSAAEVREAKAFAERLARRAIAMDGTCTGEHGIGQGKRDLLAAESGDAVAVMRQLKAALDPDGILNPGKVSDL
ncbi:MAG: FAD-linked oxidase C-terminal domain-containing protein [Hyphomicrobiaceae bacterium]|nr:FAD-linked oxidase C-terminal domain-containing protein [Hyphomicrobiaceae bacterium]